MRRQSSFGFVRRKKHILRVDTTDASYAYIYACGCVYQIIIILYFNVDEIHTHTHSQSLLTTKISYSYNPTLSQLLPANGPVIVVYII